MGRIHRPSAMADRLYTRAVGDGRYTAPKRNMEHQQFYKMVQYDASSRVPLIIASPWTTKTQAHFLFVLNV